MYAARSPGDVFHEEIRGVFGNSEGIHKAGEKSGDTGRGDSAPRCTSECWSFKTTLSRGGGGGEVDARL